MKSWVERGSGRVWSLLGAAMVVTALLAGGLGAPPAAAASSHSGGSLNVLENSNFAGGWSGGLDPPVTTTAAANATIMSAIYGQLFDQGPGGKIVPDLASGYKITDGGLTVDINIRHGVTFQDGTPFNAQAVVANMKRDLEPQYACTCAPNFPVSSVTASGQYLVVMQLSHVFAPIISSFFLATPNWVVSPTALAHKGEKDFSLHPVGAGPFEVVSNVPSSVLRLKRYPGYWKKGHPYLSSLTFTSVSADASAVAALQSHEGQVYEGLGSVSLARSIQKQFRVCTIPSVATYYIAMHTTIAPFNNILAREAIYYATDPQPIARAIFGGIPKISQTATGPGGLFWQPKVPGYRTYDLKKAKALVHQLGGLSFTLEDLISPTNNETAAALAAQWARAGIKTTLEPKTVPALVQSGRANQQQAVFSSVGSYDPALVPGLSFFFESTAPLTSVHDPHLDALINAGTSTTDKSVRAADYRKVFSYMNKMAYAPFMFTTVGFNVMDHSVSGISCQTLSGAIQWQNVSVS